jgi:fumarylacetoacetate (FAA) hydrolase
MRLASYQTNQTNQYPTKLLSTPRLVDSVATAAWVEEDTSLVSVVQAYRVICQNEGIPENPEFLSEISHLDSLIRLPGSDERIKKLSVLQHKWAHLCAQGHEAALNCLLSPGSFRLTVPLRPTSFRDFYAFEQHVMTCRANRGLEMVPEWYQFPVFYFSNASAIRGPEDPVWAPIGSSKLDFELEVACVIGTGGESIRESDATSHIAGYVILNDWSARDLQASEVKVGLGPAKGKDFATSIGPYLVTPDELKDRICFATGHSKDRIRYDISLHGAVNGKQISLGNWKDIHYSFAEMIERASADTALVAGDLIGSGTVGTGCILELGTEVQPWLQPGDVVELSIERLGCLRTPILRNPRL